MTKEELKNTLNNLPLTNKKTGVYNLSYVEYTISVFNKEYIITVELDNDTTIHLFCNNIVYDEYTIDNEETYYINLYYRQEKREQGVPYMICSISQKNIEKIKSIEVYDYYHKD